MRDLGVRVGQEIPGGETELTRGPDRSAGERTTRRWGNGAPTSGPELADSERARGAEGAERVGVGPAGREAWEWAMHAERAAALDVSEGRWAAAGSGHPWGKREVGSRAGRGERAQGRRPR